MYLAKVCTDDVESPRDAARERRWVSVNFESSWNSKDDVGLECERIGKGLTIAGFFETAPGVVV